LRSGFCDSIVCRISSGNGSRPTLTCGGVRNQNRIRGRAWRDRSEAGSSR
jgi:hypothetical protein